MLRSQVLALCSMFARFDVSEGLAQELLGMKDDMLDITTTEIKKLFSVSLAMAARTGRTSPECYAALLPLRLMFKDVCGRV